MGSSDSILPEVFVTRSATEWSGDVREAMRINNVALKSAAFNPSWHLSAAGFDSLSSNIWAFAATVSASQI